MDNMVFTTMAPIKETNVFSLSLLAPAMAASIAARSPLFPS
jgi:hypothetical protein